jgi:cytochrome c oxidase cbb3-type subunit I/II
MNLKTSALILGLFVAASATVSFAQDSQIGKVKGRAAAGKKAYAKYCIGCHGPKGDGNGENAQYIDPKPRDFTSATFKCRSTPTGTLPTDEDIFNAISRGFVTTYMPAWRALPKQERADLVTYVKTFSPKWKTEAAGHPIVVPQEPAVKIDGILHGRELFQKLECWKCHGPEGRGNGPAASTLTDSKDNPIRPFNFAEGSRFKCGETDQDLYRIFMTGVDGTPMPSFADVLQPNEAWELVQFLRTLQPLHTQEASVWKQYLSAHANDLKPIGPQQTAENIK